MVLLRARPACMGFFPANAVGDDIRLFTDETRTHERATFNMLRQQAEKPAKAVDKAYYALSDFIAPRTSSRPDYLGLFVVTAGIGASELMLKFKAEHDDYNAIMTAALADRLAEACAEWLHKKARAEWRYGRDEQLSAEELIHERYRGIRPAPGYPGCPDHTEKQKLFALLDATKNSGVSLTESYSMWPASSVSGIFFAHPEAKYIAVGKIGRDQVEDYAARKNFSVAEVERWLSPNLNYDPGKARS